MLSPIYKCRSCLCAHTSSVTFASADTAQMGSQGSQNGDRSYSTPAGGVMSESASPGHGEVALCPIRVTARSPATEKGFSPRTS